MTITFLICRLEKTGPKMTVNLYRSRKQFFCKHFMMKHAFLRASAVMFFIR